MVSLTRAALTEAKSSVGWRRCRAEAERALKASSALPVSRVESGTAWCEYRPSTQLNAPPEAPETWAADSLA